MFKKISVLFILAAALPVMAQTSDMGDLFPELRGSGHIQQPAPVVNGQMPVPSADVTVPETAAQPSPYVRPALPSSLPQNNSDEQDKPKDKIRIIPDKVQIVTPPARSFAYCNGTVTIENDTEYPLNNISLSLQFGAVQVPVTLSGIAPKTSKSQNIGSVGESCQSFLSTPQVSINSCSLGSMGKAACQSRIEYVPLQ
ncbi:MAG: hypothetical protein LBU87_02315 [Lactobacillales bacterium]|jgi:hypothetical protein|nr:hypothetical protein [Lactobacillales bacterium]